MMLQSGEHMSWQQVAMLILALNFNTVALADDANELQQTQIEHNSFTEISEEVSLYISINAKSSEFFSEVIGKAPFQLVADASNSTGENLNFYWGFGDGASSTDVRVQHLYEKSGKYALKVKVSNPISSDASTILINVLDADDADFQVVDVPFTITRAFSDHAHYVESDYDLHFLEGKSEGTITIKQALEVKQEIEEGLLVGASGEYLAHDILLLKGKRRFVFSHENSIRASVLLMLSYTTPFPENPLLADKILEFYDCIAQAPSFANILDKLEKKEWHVFDAEYTKAIVSLYNNELRLKLDEILATDSTD